MDSSSQPGLRSLGARFSHPQTDGQTKRKNQSIEQFLWIYANYPQDDWDELLPLAAFCYDDSEQSSLKTTPFFANYGFHPRLDITEPDEGRHELRQAHAKDS